MEDRGAMNDAELLREYATGRSEEAFRALIDRYVNLVYSSCRRQLGDRHLAEDATQAVFLLLSQKAGTMRHPKLAGWLLTTARFTCARIRKLQLRRLRRETAVAMANSRDSESGDEELLALLDDGLSRLKAADREAIALRYLQGRPLREVGETLGISEEAARKRVDRGVEKLRGYFARKGIPTAAGALPALLGKQMGEALLSHEIQASITRGILNACHGGAGAAPGIISLAKGTNIMMQIVRLKMATAVLVIAVAVSTAGWFTVKQVMADGVSAAPASVPAPASVAAPTVSALAAPVPTAPLVVNAVPNDGDTSVDPGLKELRVTFDQPMDTRHYSFVGGGESFPGTGTQARWIDQTTCIMPMALKPAHSYWLSINSDRFQNFRSAQGVPAAPYSISFTTWSTAGPATLATTPHVVKADPDNGATNVDPNLKELRVTFDQPMDTGGYSFVGGGDQFPGTNAPPHWVDQTTCVLPIALKPGHPYWLSINSDTFQNFRNAQGEPATPYPISFTTANAPTPGNP